MSSNKDFSERMGIAEGNESIGTMEGGMTCQNESLRITGDSMTCQNESMDSVKSDCFANWGEAILEMWRVLRTE